MWHRCVSLDTLLVAATCIAMCISSCMVPTVPCRASLHHAGLQFTTGLKTTVTRSSPLNSTPSRKLLTCHHQCARPGAARQRPASAALPDHHAHVVAVHHLAGGTDGREEGRPRVDRLSMKWGGVWWQRTPLLPCLHHLPDNARLCTASLQTIPRQHPPKLQTTTDNARLCTASLQTRPRQHPSTLQTTCLTMPVYAPPACKQYLANIHQHCRPPPTPSPPSTQRPKTYAPASLHPFPSEPIPPPTQP